ncbi:43908_t:CDS:2, partial [Gigaspora margarita]
MEEVSEHFARRLNDLDDGCVRDTKKIKTTYANDQNEETERAKIISEAMDNNLSTTTNTDLENQGAPIQILDDNNSHTVDSQTKVWENIEELQQIDHMQIHGHADHNSGTMDIEIENQARRKGMHLVVIGDLNNNVLRPICKRQILLLADLSKNNLISSIEFHDIKEPTWGREN